MKYRTIPGTDRTVSALGYGCMRLPVCADTGKIDRPRAIALIRSAIDAGVTYIDTAYGYHNGESEFVVGEALKDGYRDRVTLVTKLPPWFVKEPADMERILDEQLARLQTDHLDIYLLHALNRKSFDGIKEFGALDFLNRMIQKGKIGLPGFSFHDDFETFKYILNSYDWKLCQVQMNVLDEFSQATMEGVRMAAERGMGVIVMEPLRGGALARSIPEEAANGCSFADRYSGVEWAFRWLLDKKEFVTILSGMSDERQVQDNLRIFSEAEAGCLSDEEKKFLTSVREAYEARVRIGCTGCQYCMPCPQGIKIPDMFRAYDRAAMFDTFDQYKKWYQGMEIKADACVNCRACVSACPQHFATPIPEMLRNIHQEMMGR